MIIVLLMIISDPNVFLSSSAPVPSNVRMLNLFVWIVLNRIDVLIVETER